MYVGQVHKRPQVYSFVTPTVSIAEVGPALEQQWLMATASGGAGWICSPARTLRKTRAHGLLVARQRGAAESCPALPTARSGTPGPQWSPGKESHPPSAS